MTFSNQQDLLYELGSHVTKEDHKCLSRLAGSVTGAVLLLLDQADLTGGVPLLKGDAVSVSPFTGGFDRISAGFSGRFSGEDNNFPVTFSRVEENGSLVQFSLDFSGVESFSVVSSGKEGGPFTAQSPRVNSDSFSRAAARTEITFSLCVAVNCWPRFPSVSAGGSCDDSSETPGRVSSSSISTGSVFVLELVLCGDFQHRVSQSSCVVLCQIHLFTMILMFV
uniref:Uncharacterized protein n=1 Tax=Cacopsylla melanoneura TaxID=428564 RepID=A0A8D9ABJ3_9HEMI